MAQPFGRRLFVVWLALALLAVSAHAQDYKSLLGKWSMTSESSGDPVQWTLILKDTEGKLTASLETGEGEQPAKDLTFAEGVLKFKAPYQNAYYDIELKATADKLNGSWSGDGNSGKTSGTKQGQ